MKRSKLIKLQCFHNRTQVITDSSLDTKLALGVYPNPTSGSWSVVYELPTPNSELEVYNAQGAIVYTQTITSTTTEVNAKLVSGIYLVKVGTQMVKLVVE